MPPRAAAAAPRVVTPARKKQTGSKPPRFRLDTAPHSRAKCRRCNLHITKYEIRAGIVEDNKFGSEQRWYHEACLTDEQRQKLPTPGEQAEQDRIDAKVADHPRLKDELKKLRQRLAKEEGLVDGFKIYPNKTLDQLVIQQPTTEKGLLDIKGIGPKRLESYGCAILKVIRDYKTIPIFDIEEEEEDEVVVLERIEDMPGKEIRKELEGYGQSTEALLEKKDYENALRDARLRRGLPAII